MRYTTKEILNTLAQFMTANCQPSQKKDRADTIQKALDRAKWCLVRNYEIIDSDWKGELMFAFWGCKHAYHAFRADNGIWTEFRKELAQTTADNSKKSA